MTERVNPNIRGAPVSDGIDLLRTLQPVGPWAVCEIDPNSGDLHATSFDAKGDGPERLRAWVNERAGRKNLYLHAAVLGTDGSRRANKRDVREIRALWVDIDPDPGRFENSRVEILTSLRSPPGNVPPPTVIVDSGNGYQAYWLLETPVHVGGNIEQIEQVESRNRYLADAFGALGGDRCWSIEHLMRLPGAPNVLTEKKLAKGYPPGDRQARIVLQEPTRAYTFEQFASAAPKSASERQRASINASEALALSRIESADDLNLLELNSREQGRTRDRLVNCFLEDDSEPHDQSDALYAFCCNLVAAGYEDSGIYNIIRDERWEISRHIRDKKTDSEKHRAAVRVIEAARTANIPSSVTPTIDASEEMLPEPPPPAVIDLTDFELAELRMRPWLVPGLLMDGQVSLVVAKGGVGKSAFAVHSSVMCASAKPWVGWEPVRVTKVLLLNAEDDKDELRRRLLGACKAIGATKEQIAGRIITVEVQRLTLVARDEEGKIKKTALYGELLRICREHGIGLVVFDPLVEGHVGLDENSAEMTELIFALRDIARSLDIPVMVIHHSRKSGGDGDQDSARGSSAIAAACRTVLTMTPMASDEAASLIGNEKASEHWRYVRLTGAKQNYSERGASRWLKIESLQLGNGTPMEGDEAHEGDSVPMLVAADFGGSIDPDKWDQLDKFLSAIGAGRGNGRQYALSGASNVYALLEKDFGLPRTQGAPLVAALLSSGRIEARDYAGPDRHQTKGLFVPGQKPQVQDEIPF